MCSVRTEQMGAQTSRRRPVHMLRVPSIRAVCVPAFQPLRCIFARAAPHATSMHSLWPRLWVVCLSADAVMVAAARAPSFAVRTQTHVRRGFTTDDNIIEQ